MINFSVLISVYKNDNADHFKEAVQSVIDQTCKPSQIVIVRDGPVGEKLQEQLDEFRSHDLIDVELIDENKGLAKVLNIGLSLCKYNYVARMDSDDISLSSRFEKQTEFFKDHPEVSLLGGWYIQYDQEMKSKTNDRKVPEHHESISKFARTRTPFNHVTAMFKKDHVQTVGGYPENIEGRVEDWWLALRLIKQGYKLHNLQEYLVKVRGGQDFFDRRGGLEYLSWEIKNLRLMKKEGLMDISSFIKNLVIRSTVRLFPSPLRKGIYSQIRKFKTN